MPQSLARSDEQQNLETAVYHGGDLGAARRQFPDAPTSWLDLSTGINPIAYPVEGISPEVLARLPDASAIARLQAAAADAYGAKNAKHIVCTPGSQAAIQWLPQLVQARRVAILGFGYQEYPAVWGAAGADVIVVQDVDELIGPAVDLAVVVNPNNPDGRLIDTVTLLDIAAQMARRGGLLVVDEAFMDVMRPNVSLVPHLPPRGAMVLRSFGKAYGLAGLRLGFVVAEIDLANKFCAALGPWAVSGPAVEIAVKALSDKAWLAQAVARLERDAARLDALLTKAGFDILGGTPLFRLAKHQRARQWFEILARCGLLTRPFPERQDWLRFGLPGHETDWVRLTDALSISGH
jgi:cobalamin biosynthesis protein CobC